MRPRPLILRGTLQTLLIGTLLLALVFPLLGGQYAAAAPAADPPSALVLAPRGLLDGLKGVEVAAKYDGYAVYRVPDHLLAALAPEVRAQVTVVGSLAEAEALLGLGAGAEGSGPLAYWPGPDGYGYVGQEVAYKWEEIDSATPITGLTDDSFAGPFDIGFTFSFYGVDYTQFYVSSNGLISFGAGSSSLSDQCPLPNATAPNSIVALMWDDLYPNYGSGGLYYSSFADCPVGVGGQACLIVEYDNWELCCAGETAGTFQAILYANGAIRIQYKDAGDEAGLNSTSGIEGNDAGAGHGLVWVCNTIDSIVAKDAIEFAALPDFTLDTTPALRAICAGQDALYTNALAARNGFNSAVTLSAAGQPGGATAAFSPNPITPPGESALTIGSTGGAAFGLYDITVTGVGGGQTHSDMVQLQVYSSVPAAPALSSPADGALDVALQPTLAWGAAAQATGYYLQVATDPAFADVVYSAAEGTTGHSLGSPLDPATPYYWRVRGSNLCGDGAYSGAWSFTTRSIPPLLLVDDDDNAPNVRAYYTTALDAIGIGYDVWDTGSTDTNEPDAATLALYQGVIWFSGDNISTPGPGAGAETALAGWLDGGSRCLFVSSEDYYFDKGLTSFMDTYLGVSAVGSDTGDYTSVTGQGGVYGGLGPYALNYSGAGLLDYSDYLLPDAGAEVGFLGNNSNEAAIDKDNSSYRTTFWGYPFEALSTAADREEALRATLAWCGVLGPDYSLQAGPALRTICAPNDAVYDVTLTALGGFASPVTLAAAGQPAGTTAAFVPNPVTPSGNSVLTIGSTGAAAAGLYDITVTGVGGGKTHDDGVQLQVVVGVPAAPTLVAPADGATLVAVNPTLEWTAVPNAADYALEVATDPGFAAVVYSATSGGASHTVATALSYNTLYYWRVQARNYCGSGPWAAAFTFTTIPAPPQDLTISPNDADLDIFFNCDTAAYNGAFQVQRVGAGQTYYPPDEPGDFGIFVSYNGCVIGPDVVGQTFDDKWDTCLASEIVGGGTVADPWQGKARFATSGCGSSLVLTYTLSYIEGNDYYQTDYRVCGGTPGDPFTTYFAADLYVEGSDYGYGYYYSPTMSIGCWRPGVAPAPDIYMYLTPGAPYPPSHYQEALYSTIWAAVANTANLADTIDDTDKDTGAGLQWDLTFGADGCAAVSAYTSFSHVGIYVDDDYTAATPGWNTTHFDTIQEGILVARTGDIVYVENLTEGVGEVYVESVTLNKDVIVRVNNSIELVGSLTIQNGNWMAPMGTMRITGSLAQSGGVFDPRGGTVRFTGGGLSTFSFSGSGTPTTFYNLVVEAGKVLEVAGTDAPLFEVAGSIVNDGLLRQTRTVPAAPATTAFLNISGDRYYGVDIQPVAQQLGVTRVTVSGNQSCPESPAAVWRCFEIEPGDPNQAADVTFYYRDAEENLQLAPDVYHYDGAAWDLQTLGARDTAGVEDNWVRAVGIADYSPFGLWGGVLAVKLVSFAAAPAARGILVTWETASEHDNAGFNLYRSATVDGPGERVNAALIPSRSPGGDQGAAYDLLDAAALPGGTYYYWLEDVDLSGARTRHGPVAVGLWRAYLPVVAR